MLQSNSVPNAIAAACAIYGVRCYRMNSRALNVIGKGGNPRPMFMGRWTDRFGTEHTKGMADLLLTPNLAVIGLGQVAVTVWCECKSGRGVLTYDQELFRDDVLDAGAFYIEAHDSADAVIEWFRAHGVTR